jgi:8-oxo-dGTP pyrophosphatase MutT (NUDIX family)
MGVLFMSNYIKDIRAIVGHTPIRSVSTGILVEYDNQILLQHRSDTNDYGTPGGNVELDEKVIEAARRELLEETGIQVENLTFFGIYSGESQVTIYPNGDITYYVVIVFYTKLSKKPTLIKDEESHGLDFYPKDQLPKPLKPTDVAWIDAWVKGDFDIKVD